MPTAFPQEHADYIVVKVEGPRLANDVLLLPKELIVKVANCTFLHSVPPSMSPLRNKQIVCVKVEGYFKCGHYRY